MPQLKLTYFGMPGRAEPARLAFVLGGIAFEDNNITWKDWSEMKEKVAPLMLPQLEVDGKVVSQSLAIARYACKLAKVEGKPLYPEDPYQALLVDEIVDKVQDLWEPLVPTFTMKDQKEKEAKRAALVAKGGDVEKWAANLDSVLAQNASGFAVGDSLSMADLSIFLNVNGILSGFLDGIPTDCLDHLTHMSKHKDKMANIPQIAKHYETKEGPAYAPFKRRASDEGPEHTAKKQKVNGTSPSP
ncbi:Glutathione S-transferase 1 [Diplonema papillatum]|nr:Glutathione S-transferase 1 [Diplonema papillatum]